MSNEIEVKVGQVWESKRRPGRQRTIRHAEGGKVCYWDGTELDLDTTDWVHRYHTLVSDPNQPWLPLPDGYRLVTDEEKEKYKKPAIEEYRFCCGGKWEPSKKNSGGFWHREYEYAVPVNHEWEEDAWKPEPGDVIEVADQREWNVRIFKGMKGEDFTCFNGADSCGIPSSQDTDPDSMETDLVLLQDWPKARPVEPTEVIDMTPPQFKLFEAFEEDEAYHLGDCACPDQRVSYSVFGYTDDEDWISKVNILLTGNVPHYDREPCDWKGDRKYAIGRLI